MQMTVTNSKSLFFLFWILVFNFDHLVKSLKRSISVIPANPGSSPGQAPESSSFKYLKILWTPVSTGVTFFRRTSILDFFYYLCALCGNLSLIFMDDDLESSSAQLLKADREIGGDR